MVSSEKVQRQLTEADLLARREKALKVKFISMCNEKGICEIEE